MSELRPFQRQVAERLLEGHNVILQAPTGAGKTRAALTPLLNSLKHKRDFPRKCIYAVPMRVLANQFVDEYQPQITEQTINLKTEQERVRNQRRASKPFVDIQTGERRGDPSFEAVLTFATIDQVLSSFLCAPYSLPTRLANLSAGAIAASYLVFDEFHLFGPDGMLPTTLEMLQMLHGVAPFLLMTATFSRTMLFRLAEILDAVVVGGTVEEQAEFAQLPSQNKIRRFHTTEVPLTAEQVLQHHKGRSIVICNQVERAQMLFKAVCEQASAEAEVVLLHSRFLKNERAAIEKRILDKFRKNSDPSGSIIVVSTQAIEVGLDISCSVLHSELAPANAIIQRAGRCARYDGTQGDVFIYRYSLERDGSQIDLIENTMPYADKETKEVIGLTWEAFEANQGQLDYAGEQEVLNHAHQVQDEKLCEKLRSGHSEHRRKMFDVMSGGEQRKQAANLIRDINSQRVIIHNDPDHLLEALERQKRSPYSLEGFNLQIGTLQGYAKDWLLERILDEEPPFRVKYLSVIPASEQPDPEQGNQPIYQWIRADEPKTVIGAPVIVVHPVLAGYQKKLGFLPREGNRWIMPDPQPDDEANQELDHIPGYRLETYEKHIDLVYGQFQDVVWSELSSAATKLEQRCNWPEGSLWQAARLAVLLHDTGKLNVGWQQWVRKWQKFIGLEGSLSDGEVYAHTDNYLVEHWQRSREFKQKRPPHAVEGAIASSFVLADQLRGIPDLLRAAFSAIARHHAPDSSEFQPFQLEKDAEPRTRRILQRYAPELQIDGPKLINQGNTKDVLIGPTPNQEAAYLAYILLARALRRADQRGTAMGTQKE